MDLKKSSLLPREISGAENIRLRKLLNEAARKLYIVDFGLKAGLLRSRRLNISLKLKTEKFSAGMENIGKVDNHFD